ncbi:MAG: hypothetical protein KDA93_08960 [Planctomycetaceae bacterium]|nr:hypothetical protein [Planctomycetaceae bacterium]
MLHGASTLLMRALREDANRRGPHFFRLGGTLLILVFLMTAHIASTGVGAPGLRFFKLISSLNLLLIVVAGASYFATAITEEKEQGTLGLLHLAGVSPIGLLLGKSTSRLISVLLVFLGQLPFALLAITLGGITARQIIAVDLALAAFLIMVANVALMLSVICQRSSSACSWMFLGLVFLLLGVQYGDESVSQLVRRGFLSADSALVKISTEALNWLNDLAIITRINEVLEIGYDGSLTGAQFWLHLSVALVAFVLSWLTFDRFTRYSDVSSPARGWLPQSKTRWRILVGRPWRWAFVWKDYHFITGGHTLAIFKLIVYPLMLFLMWRYQNPLYTVTGLFFPSLARRTMLIVIGGELILSASRVFHEEIKWGTLPSVASLPQSVIVTTYSKLLGCLLGLIPAVLVLGVVILLVPPSPGKYDAWIEPGWWLLWMEFLVLVHLTTLLSLRVKWGALALAVTTLLVINALLFIPVSLVAVSLVDSFNDRSALISPIVYIGATLCMLLQGMIVFGVRDAAAR